MGEMAIMDIIKIFIGMLLIGLIISTALFLVQLLQVSSFKQHVNYQIERNGGLTEIAIDDIKEYSEEYFDGKFSVDSPLLNKKVSYGEPVDYTLTGTFNVLLLPMPDLSIDFTGTGVSQVR